MSIPHRTNATASTSIKDITTFFLAANAAVNSIFLIVLRKPILHSLPIRTTEMNF